jgi:hypothetical protein
MIGWPAVRPVIITMPDRCIMTIIDPDILTIVNINIHVFLAVVDIDLIIIGTNIVRFISGIGNIGLPVTATG